MREYVLHYCYPGAEPSKDGKINIHDVRDFPLKIVLFTITKLVGTVTLHVANRSYMKYMLECMEPTVFNWAEAIISQMKEQLSKEKGGRKKKIQLWFDPHFFHLREDSIDAASACDTGYI